MIVQIAAAGFPHLLPFMYSQPHFAEQGVSADAVEVGFLFMALFRRGWTQRSDLVQKNHDELVWLNDHLLALPALFSPYLGFQSAK